MSFRSWVCCTCASCCFVRRSESAETKANNWDGSVRSKPRVWGSPTSIRTASPAIQTCKKCTEADQTQVYSHLSGFWEGVRERLFDPKCTVIYCLCSAITERHLERPLLIAIGSAARPTQSLVLVLNALCRAIWAFWHSHSNLITKGGKNTLVRLKRCPPARWSRRQTILPHTSLQSLDFSFGTWLKGW